MATCPMCNAENVSDDPNDTTGHDMTKHGEGSTPSEGAAPSGADQPQQ